MSIKSFRELIVWQKSMDLTEEVYLQSKQFPNEEKYGLTNQIRRAAVSVPSNIAEGQVRKFSKEFRQFLFIAKASNAELSTQLEIAYRLDYIRKESFEKILSNSIEIDKMLQSLVSKL